jgi:hypothetical protein
MIRDIISFVTTCDGRCMPEPRMAVVRFFGAGVRFFTGRV